MWSFFLLLCWAFSHLSFDGESIDEEQLSTGGGGGQRLGRTGLENERDRKTERWDEKVVAADAYRNREKRCQLCQCCPFGNISTVINHIWKHWWNPPPPPRLSPASPANSPPTAHIISLTKTHAHTKTDTKWYDSTIPFRNARKEKLLLAHSLSLAKLLCSTLLQSEATSALCWSLKRQRGTHTVPLLPCGTRSLWCEKKYVVSLCQSLAREATKKGKKRGC